MLKNTLRVLCTTFALFVLLTAVGQAADAGTDVDQRARAAGVPVTDLRAFAEVLERIRTEYVGEVDESELIQSAIRGMLMDLDPHSAYLAPDQIGKLEAATTGEFGGLGLEVTMHDGLVKVVSPIDGSPASDAGLRAGDLILKIDNAHTKGMTLQDAVEKMRGKAGTKVTLSVRSEGESNPREVTLTRDEIQVHSVKSRMLEPGYGYLRISQFQSNTGKQVAEALRKLESEHELDGLVLDLRNNPGGVLKGAVKVADLFLDHGLIVYTQGRDPEDRTDYSATSGDALNGRPLIVLVNGGSASASEIVSGALQDQHRAIVVGTRTFGKGSVQTIMPISGDHALKLTTARYYTPSGRSIQAEGITPDIPIRVRSVQITEDHRIHESDLPGHLTNPDAKGESDSSASSKAPLAARDYPLSRALDLLRGITLSQRHPDAPRAGSQPADDGDTSGAQ